MWEWEQDPHREMHEQYAGVVTREQNCVLRMGRIVLPSCWVLSWVFASVFFLRARRFCFVGCCWFLCWLAVLVVGLGVACFFWWLFSSSSSSSSSSSHHFVVQCACCRFRWTDVCKRRRTQVVQQAQGPRAWPVRSLAESGRSPKALRSSHAADSARNTPHVTMSANVGTRSRGGRSAGDAAADGAAAASFNWADAAKPLVVEVGGATTRIGYAGDDYPRAFFPTSSGVRHAQESPTDAADDDARTKQGAKGSDASSGADKDVYFVGNDGVQVSSLLSCLVACVPPSPLDWCSPSIGLLFFFALLLKVARPGMHVVNPLKGGLVDNWDLLERVWEHGWETLLQADTKSHPMLMIERSFNKRSLREKLCEVRRAATCECGTASLDGRVSFLRCCVSRWCSKRTKRQRCSLPKMLC